MPSKLEVQIFERYAQYADKCWVFGVDIHETHGFLFPTKNKKKLFAQYIFLSWMLLLVVLCAYRNYILYHQIYTNSGGIGWFVVYAILTVIHSAYLIWFAIFAIWKAELTNLWNQLLHYSRNGIDSKLDGNIREKIICLGHYALKFAMVSGGVIIAVPEYIYAAGQEGWPLAMEVGFPIIIFSVSWLYLGILGLLIIYSVMFFLNVIDTLERNTLEPQLIEVTLRSFKLLSLLCKHFNGAYASAVIPSAKYLVSFIAMFCFYVGIRVKLPHLMKCCFLATFMAGIIYATLLANVLSIIWLKSKEFLAQSSIVVCTLEDTRNKMHLRRDLRSLRPLRICVGGLYYMEAEAKLTFMAFLVNGTANLLIAFK